MPALAVVLIEHDMSLVMGISDQIVVLDAGKRSRTAGPTPCATTRRSSMLIWAARSSTRGRVRPGWQPAGDAILSVKRLTAGYGAARRAEAAWTWRSTAASLLPCSAPTAPASRR